MPASSAAEPQRLVRATAATDPAHGKRPEERAIEEHLRLGVVALDKPAGPTSHQVVAWLKVAMGLEKAGHGGTLDPNVTGVLPVALLDATRVVKTLLEAPKEYVCVLETHKATTPERMREVLAEFVGPVYQVPPLKSAVKRELRVRRIYALDVMDATDRVALFRVSCEAGTYVRKLCSDAGLVLGTGGHMRDLRRSRSGPFAESECVTLHDLHDAYLFWKEQGDESWLRRAVMPVERLVAHLPRVVVRDSAVDALCHGAELAVPGLLEADAKIRPNDLVACFTLKGELISVGRAMLDASEMAKRESGAAVKTSRVVMDPGTYPRGWTGKRDA